MRVKIPNPDCVKIEPYPGNPPILVGFNKEGKQVPIDLYLRRCDSCNIVLEKPYWRLPDLDNYKSMVYCDTCKEDISGRIIGLKLPIGKWTKEEDTDGK